MQIYDGRYDRRSFPTKRTAAVVSAGQILCTDYDQMTIRKNGREDWSLFYCEEGRVWFEDQALEAGQVWIYPPGMPQKYTVYWADRTAYRFLHFTGSDVAALLSSLEIPLHSPVQVKNALLSQLFDNIQDCLADISPLSALNAEVRTLHLISQIAKGGSVVSRAHMMKRVTDNMEHSFAAPYDAQRYAGMLQISVSRFNHLFRECMGMPPYAFYVKLRITNACDLLEETDLKIMQVAEKCGYEDPLYFAQAFRKVTGTTPSAYRKAKRTGSKPI